MKQLIFISILLLNTMLVIAQNNCDSLRYYISSSPSVDDRKEVTDQVIDEKLIICEDWDTIYVSATSTNRDLIEIGQSTRISYEFLKLSSEMEESLYYIIYINENDGVSYCKIEDQIKKNGIRADENIMISFEINPESCKQIVDGIDIAIKKRLAYGQTSLVAPGSLVTFTIEIYNQGTVPVSQIALIDYIPNGLILNDSSWSLTSPQTAEVLLNPPLTSPEFIPGGLYFFNITFTVSSNVNTPTITNAAEISFVKLQNGDVIYTDEDSNFDQNSSNDGTPVNDAVNNPNDEDDHDIETITIDACGGVAGTMPIDTIYACNTDSISTVQNGSTLALGDVDQYILHTNPNNISGTILSSNNTGTFANPNVDCTTLYISYIFGPDSGNGTPDLSSDCTIILPGTPVVWSPPIKISSLENCSMDNQMYSVTYIVSGGFAACDNSKLLVTGDVNQIVATSGQTYLDTTNFSNNYGYTIFASDIKGCSNYTKKEPMICEDNINIIFEGDTDINGDYQPLEIRDTLYICSQIDAFFINSVNSNNRQHICTWHLNDEMVNTKVLELTIPDIDTTYQAKYTIINPTDDDTDTLYQKSFAIRIVEPPSLEHLKITPAPSCDGTGSVSFVIKNNNEELGTYYNIDNDMDGDTTNLALGNHQLEIGYDEEISIIGSCTIDTTLTINTTDGDNVQFIGLKNAYCVGDTLKISLENSPEPIKWIINDEEVSESENANEIQYVFLDSDAGNLSIKISYSCNGAPLEYEENSIVHLNPSLKINANHTSTICSSDALELMIESDSLYTNFEWTVNDVIAEERTATISINNLLEGDNTYSVKVTDMNGCFATSPGSSIFVYQGVDVVLPTKEDMLCKGTKVFYANTNSFDIDNKENNLYQDKDLRFAIVEWNVAGTFDEGDNSKCNKVEIKLLTDKAPNGKIKPFGISNTLVFADSDNSANRLQYQWFYVDLNESAVSLYNEIYNANERVIDCNDFDCLFAFATENTNKVLGLEIYDDQSGCTNLIFYDKFELFLGLKDIPVGLVDVKFNQHFHLYPNLNQGKFFIQIKTPPKHTYTLAIYNTFGELIQTKNLIHQSNQQINISNTEEGIYFAVLKQKNQAIAQQKLIIY